MNAERLIQLYDRVSDAPDAIPRLRRFILDLAIRGKLVEQDPDDEPAAELLRKIEDEKVRLVKAGEIRKPKDLPPVSEPPYSLPKRWIWARMRQVTSDRGQKIPTDRFTYLDVTSIDKEAGVISDPKILESSEAPSRARKITRKGDVIYSCVRPYLLNVALITDDFDREPIASTAFAVLNGHGLLVPRYIWIVLRSPFMVACVEENQRGQAYPAINDADFSLLPFPLPPLREQHRIVAKVDELMAICDSLEAERDKREATRDRLTTASLGRLTARDVDGEQFKAHANFAINVLSELTTRPDQIKLLRQTVLDLAVRGKLVEQDPNDEPAEMLVHSIADVKNRAIAEKRLKRGTPSPPVDPRELAFPLPDRWALSRLGAVFDVRDGTHDTPKYVDDGVPLVTSKNLSSGTLSLDGVKLISVQDHHNISARSHVEKGDVLFAMIGSIGNPVIVDIDCEFSIKNVALFKYYDPKLASPRFLRYFLMHAAGEMKTRAVGGLQPFVSLGFLRHFPIPLPPLAEQNRIVDLVDVLMMLCDHIEEARITECKIQSRLLEVLLMETVQPMVQHAA